MKVESGFKDKDTGRIWFCGEEYTGPREAELAQAGYLTGKPAADPAGGKAKGEKKEAPAKPGKAKEKAAPATPDSAGEKGSAAELPDPDADPEE